MAREAGPWGSLRSARGPERAVVVLGLDTTQGLETSLLSAVSAGSHSNKIRKRERQTPASFTAPPTVPFQLSLT